MYPVRDHDGQNFRGSIQTPLTCFPRLPTFVSSGRRVQLLGCWLGFTRGRTFTSWIVSTDFRERATLASQQLRHSSRHRFSRPVGRDANRCDPVRYDSTCSHAELSCLRTRKRPRSRFRKAGSSMFGRLYCTSCPWPNTRLGAHDTPSSVSKARGEIPNIIISTARP